MAPFYPFIRTPLVLLCGTILITTTEMTHGAREAELAPVLAKPGRELANEDFKGPSLGAPWKVAKGDWQVREGTLVARELKDDKHAGVCSLEVPNKDSIIRFSYRLQGAKSLSLSLNHPKGHLFRVILTADGVAVNKDKDKKDPNSTGGPLGKATLKSEPSEWHTVQLEMLGAKIAVTGDSGLKIQAEDPALDVPKTGYRLVIAGENAEVAGLRVWEAAP